MKSLDEYVEKWFKPITIIGADEGLIVETLTLIVGQEGPSYAEIPFALIFVNTKPPAFEDVRRGVLAIPEVLSADHVFGPYDLVCHVRARDRVDLERVLLSIQTSDSGIERTLTCIIKEVY